MVWNLPFGYYSRLFGNTVFTCCSDNPRFGMFTDRQKRLCLRVVAAAVLVFMALIIVFGVSESNFRWGF